MLLLQASPAPTNYLVLPISEGVRLVSIDTVRAARGLRADAIIKLAEDHLAPGHLPAFDVSVGQPRGRTREPRRELRFWAGALAGQGRWRDLIPPGALLDFIIADCLLTTPAGLADPRALLHRSQIERAWCVSVQMIARLVHAGEITGSRRINWRVNRFSAAEFLRRRAL